jgi:GntR family transcriptional repressor for pyruvate dehydrogenase complex
MPAYPGDPVDDITAALGALPSGTPVSEVARRLLDLFTGGSIAPGTRLPPERQLATGSGTYLRGAASELLPQTLRWGLLIGERNTAQLLELREGLEIFVARLAAARADAAMISRLEKHVVRMREGLDDLAAFAKADLDFHHALAEAAGNATLTDHLHVIRSLLQVYADRAVHDHDHAVRATAEHEAVLEGVRAGDGDAAASAMAVHMATATDRLLAERTN